MTVYIFTFIFGAVFGSFFNVLIYRIPLKKSISFPPSHCPSCGERIKFYDNIPILSYILLRGRCRACGNHISPIYPAVELITGAVFCSVLFTSGPTFWTLAYIISFSFMIVLSGIDLKYKEVNVAALFIPAAILGILHILSRYGFVESAAGAPIAGAKDAVIGLLSGSVFFLLIRFAGSIILKREAMGEADIYIGGLIGLMLGYKLFFYSVILAGVLGILYYLAEGKKSAEREIPFFPYLSAGAFGAYMLHEVIKRVLLP